LSSLKHTFGGIPLANVYGYNYIQVALLTAAGAVLGVLFYLFLSKYVFRIFQYIKPEKKVKDGKRIFSKKNRMIVKIKRKWGLYGIAFLTPPLLSIPIGTTIAISIYKDKKRVFFFMLFAILFWSFLGAWVGIPIKNLFAALWP
ncbi:MAG: hypothetical protein AAFV80_00330, partial [Bacteroidota bacterium]